jgi:hypothetical protein
MEIYPKLWQALGYPDRYPIVIGIDGRYGKGKTSLASWIAWQFGMSAIHLDLFLVRGKDRIEWRISDLKRCVEARLKLQKPILIEGVKLLDALDEALSLKPHFLIFVGPARQEEDLHEPLASEINDYFERRRPASVANFHLEWTPPDRVS